MAKTYTRTEQFSNAEFLLKGLEKNLGINQKVRDEIAPAMADLLIKQKDYKQALLYLDQAIEGNASKNNKARYAYIAGQIHRLLKDPTTASTYFLKAKNQPKILSSSLCRNSLMQLLWHPAPMEGRKLRPPTGEISERRQIQRIQRPNIFFIGRNRLPHR